MAHKKRVIKGRLEVVFMVNTIIIVAEQMGSVGWGVSSLAYPELSGMYRELVQTPGAGRKLLPPAPLWGRQWRRLER